MMETERERKIKSQKEFEMKLKQMEDLDYDIAIELICERVKKEKKERCWTWKQIGDLIGSERTYSCSSVSGRANMRATNLIRFSMAFDWDLNELLQEIIERMRQAPQKLHKPKKKEVKKKK